MSYLSPACRGLILAVFVLAVVGKARSRASYAAFAQTLDVPGLVPSRLRRFAPGALLAAECVAVLLLAIPATGVLGFAVAGALLTSFAVAVAWSLRRGVQVRCRCFGADEGVMDRSHVVRNACLALGALLGLVSTLTADAPSVPGAIAALGTGVLVGTVSTRWDDLRFLFSAPTTRR